MGDVDQWKGIAPLPSNTSSTTNGKYSISHLGEKTVSADGSDIQTEVWFQTPPLDPTTISRLHSLQLVAESHDQGFCDNPLAGNWTWLELAIMENEHSTSARTKDDIKLIWRSHRNRFCTEEYGWKAGTVFRDTDDMFRLLEDGNVIAVRLCARFSGWEISARSGYLIIELGSEVERQPLKYGQIASKVKIVQEAFQDVNNAILPDEMQIPAVPSTLFRAQMLTSADNRPLRVLSLDGGGVRGVAALMMLDAVMKKVAPNKKPCEVFDLIGGTSTGGFIAIMLGRLKMTIAECLAKYKEFMDIIFPTDRWTNWYLLKDGAKWDAGVLEKVIKKLIRDKLQRDPDRVLLMDDQSEKDPCKIFVMAAKQTGANNSAPVFLRSYKNPLQISEVPGIKLWEAARATSAAPTYFLPMKVGNIGFIDGGLQANNPLGWLWNEILTVFGPARPTNCFLSIGTGIPAPTTVNRVSINPKSVVNLANAVSGIATNSDITTILFRSLINAFAPVGLAKKYWRFSFGDGLPDWVQGADGVWRWTLLAARKEEDIGDLDDVKAIRQTEERARRYLALPGAGTLVGEAAAALSKELT